MSTFGPLAAHAAPYLKLTLPAKFYNPPADAPALFSTRNGTRAKRQICSPPPAPVVRSDFDQEVKRMAALLRKELPQVAGLIRNPSTWKDLYYFFDAVDLWVEGAVFLYYVVSHISKDNVVAQETYNRMQQNAMIFQYAGNWVAENAGQIAKLPPQTDFITLFNQSQRSDIRGFRDHELEGMREALRFHHSRLREKYSAVGQAQCVDTLQLPASLPAHAVQQGFAPVVPHSQAMAPQPLPLLNGEDKYHHKIASVRPVADPHMQTYSHGMGPLRINTTAAPIPATAPYPAYKENNQQREPRARGYSNETGPNDHSQSGAHLSQGNQGHPPVTDQRMVGNGSYDSPPRSVPQVNQPIYVHNSQCVSPPQARGAVVNTRIFSDSQTGRNGLSNDARLWNGASLPPGRHSHTAHESFVKSGQQSAICHRRSWSVPFEDHPNAKITDKASTFYYKKECIGQKPEFANHRTLYVNGATVEMFSSHSLKDMMSEVGTVESISYLYSNPSLGPAFVTFTEESALQPAISRFNGITTPSGRRLEVKMVDKNKPSRDRSGSQSGHAYYSSNYLGRNNHRNFRKNSTSTRQYSRSHPTGNTIKSQNNSPDAHKHWSGTRSPHTQAQSPGSLPYTVPIPVEQLHSSISEIMQHQSALERLRLAQMPLEPIDNYYGGNRKVTGPPPDNSRWTKKENSPAKDGLKNTTPAVPPNKEPVDIYSDGNNNIGYKSKEGFKQEVAMPRTTEVAPVKPESKIDLVEILRASVRQRGLMVPFNMSGSNGAPKTNETDSATEPLQASVHHTSPVEPTTEPEQEPTKANLRIPFDIGAPTVTIKSSGDSLRAEETSVSRKLKKNKKKQGTVRSESSGFSESTATTSVASVDTSSPTLTDTTDYKSATTSFSEASSRNPSFASAKSTVGLSTTNGSPKEQNMEPIPTPINKRSKTSSSSSSSSFSTPKPHSSRNQDRTRNFTNRSNAAESHSNTQMADAASGSCTDKKLSSELLNSTSEDISCSYNANDTDCPVTALQDPEEWPALERIKTRSSKIVDGKPPVIASLPPTTRHSTSTTKNPNVVIPVLPLNMIPRRSNSNETAESQAWPRVRKCIGK